MLIDKIIEKAENSPNKFLFLKALRNKNIEVKESKLEKFFGLHASIKILTQDLNSAIYSLMYQHLLELERGMVDLARISMYLYTNEKFNMLDYSNRIFTQLIISEQLLTNGINIYAALLNLDNNKENIESLKLELIKAREAEQVLYEELKIYEPFKIENFNSMFIKKVSNNLEKTELNNSINRYENVVKSLRAFSTLLSILPHVIQTSDVENKMAKFFKERFEMTTSTKLTDKNLVYKLSLTLINNKKMFEPSFSESNYVTIKSKNILTQELFLEREFLSDYKWETKDVLNMEYDLSEFKNMQKHESIIFNKQLDYIKKEIEGKNCNFFIGDLSKSPKIFSKGFLVSLVNYINFSYLNDDIENKWEIIKNEPLIKYISPIDITNIFASDYIQKCKELEKEKSIVVNVEKDNFINEDMKKIPKTLYFGNNVASIKNVLEKRENSEKLIKKLEIFYKIRISMNKDHQFLVSSIDILRSYYKGLSLTIKSGDSIIMKELREIALMSILDKKEVVKHKAKI